VIVFLFCFISTRYGTGRRFCSSLGGMQVLCDAPKRIPVSQLRARRFLQVKQSFKGGHDDDGNNILNKTDVSYNHYYRPVPVVPGTIAYQYTLMTDACILPYQYSTYQCSVKLPPDIL